MKTKEFATSIFIVLIFIAGFQFCKPPSGENYKVVYINSYHRGHPSSDEIMDVVTKEFSSDSFEFHSYIMDTKRNPSQEYIENISASLNDSITAVEPDIVIVSDDNAVKYLIQPYFQEKDLPVVFCGINWSDKEYNLREVDVTGMLEVLPLAETILTVKSFYPSVKKLLVLNENTTTSRKEKTLLDTLFTRVGVEATHVLVNDFKSWKTNFIKGNELYDIIYISTNGAISGWDKDKTIDFVYEHINVPVFTCEDFMMPYAVLGRTKVAKEQGIWAAKTAKKILKGESPSDIPVTKNQQSVLWLNTKMADKINFKPDETFLSKAVTVN